MSGRGDAQIVERGFQRYEGRRSGVRGAIRSVSWEGIRATLGLGRPARTKIFPVIAVVIAYLPAIVFVGIAVLIPGDILEPEEVADYPGYYGFIILAIVLFTALVAPEVLVSDRRNGMLAMYLSTPLDRRTYLVAKAVAVISTLGLVTLGPPVLLLIGYTVEGVGPDGVAGWLWTLVRIMLSGIAISAALAAVSMAASSLTDRQRVRRDRHRAARAGVTDPRDRSRRGRGPVGVTAAHRHLDDAVRVGLPHLRSARQLPRAVDVERPAEQHRVDPRRRRRGVVALLQAGDRAMTGLPPPAAAFPPPVPGQGGPPPPPAPLSGMIAVNAVSKYFGSVVAVSDVSFAVNGGVTALLGPNGAGKSTLFRMLCGLTPPSRGSVDVLGFDPRGP